MALTNLFDFFDDTGVVDDPGGRVGYVLRDAREAAPMATVGVKLNEALDAASREAWQDVAAEARERPCTRCLDTPCVEQQKR